MKRKIDDLQDHGEEVPETLQKKAKETSGKIPVEIFGLMTPYLIDREDPRGTGKNLGSVKRVSQAALAGVELTADSRAFNSRLNRLGRIGDSMCSLLLATDNRKSMRWVSSDIPEPPPEVEYELHNSFSIRAQIGIAHCVEILRPVLRLLSNDHTSSIVDHINVVVDDKDRAEILHSIKEEATSFQEREQVRLLEGADRIIKSRARYGGDINPACAKAIEFVVALERKVKGHQKDLQEKISKILSINSKGRDDIAREIDRARRANPMQAARNFDIAHLSPFIQRETDKMKGKDIDKDIDHVEKTINRALAQFPGSSGFLNADKYASDIAYAMRPLASLLERTFDTLESSEKASRDSEARKSLSERPRARDGRAY